ncbi:DUF1330 domain-containing protein [Streptomyces sp. NRRL F-5065]|uniref:DUF1330 domain-containing protein n=1 Tax=Streptomyces sp. NRRL F-5065 TaxID=1463855 RepID=UPI0004C2A75D|nr:DUF1330 domain-containing protein [Streptomyces sp. NRRL F-5065]
MPAYAFAHLRDRRHHGDVLEYIDRVQDTLDPFGGRFLIHGPPAEVVEGDWPGGMVLIEFPDLAGARAWYASPAYQEILPLRTRHIDGDAVLADGVGPGYHPSERAAKLRAAAAEAHRAPAPPPPA